MILSALAGGRLHGYGIIAEVKALSSGELVLSAGTLYAALDRLLEADLIKVARESTHNGRFRRDYALAPSGRKMLAADIARREARLARVRSRLNPKEST